MTFGVGQTFDEIFLGASKIPGSLVPFLESTRQPASPVEELRPDSTRIVRTIYVPWDLRTEAVRAILGYPKVVTIEGEAYISRQTPWGYAGYLANETTPFAYATEAVVEGHGLPDPDPLEGVVEQHGDDDVALYGMARVRVTFETLLYDVVSDDQMQTTDGGVPDEASCMRYTRLLPTPQGEFLPTPENTLWWVDGTGTASAVPGFPLKAQNKERIILTWWDVPETAIGMQTINPFGHSFPIDDAIGCVNSDYFPAGEPQGFAPGTLLLEGATPVPVRSPFGQRLYRLEFHILRLDLGDAPFPPAPAAGYRVGHNFLLRATGGSIVYQEVSPNGTAPVPSNLDAKADGKSLYNWRPFAPMLRPPP